MFLFLSFWKHPGDLEPSRTLKSSGTFPSHQPINTRSHHLLSAPNSDQKQLNFESISHARSAPQNPEFSSRTTATMDFRLAGLDSPLFATLHHLMDVPDEADKSFNAPTRTYVRDARAMAATPADVKEYPGSYAFVVDMPGLKSGDISVQVQDDNVLVISGERKREEEKEGAKYLRMERRVGKFMRKFTLPENANTEAVSAVCRDGVLTVTVEKLPPPEPKKPKTFEVKVA